MSWNGTGFSDYSKKNNDIQVITAFNEAIGLGKTSIEAYNAALANTGMSINDVSKNAADLMKHSKGASVDIETYSKSVKGLGLSSTIATVGMQLLASAIQTTAISLVSLGIKKLFDVIDHNIHKIDKLRDSIANIESEYQNTTSELECVNAELEETKQLISELEHKDSLSFVEEEELRNLQQTNVELERRQRLLERQQALLASQNIASKTGLFNSRFGIQERYVEQSAKYYNDFHSQYGSKIGDYALIGTENEQIDLARAIASYKYLSELLSDSTVQNNIDEGAYDNYVDMYEQIEDILIGSLDDLESLRSDLLDMKVGGKTLTDKQDSMLSWADSYIASIWQTVDPEYWFSSNFNNIISDVAHKDAVAKLKDLSEQGKLTAEALSSSMTDTGIKAFVDELYAAGITDTAQIVAEINKLYGDINETATKEQGAGYDAITSSLYSTKSAYEALSAAMEEQASAGKISASTYTSLIAQNADFANFLEKTADGYALNTDALNDYLEAQNNLSKGKAIARIMELQEALGNINLTDDSINAYKAEISQLEVLISELDNATDAYARLMNARDTANQDAGYQKVKSGYEQFTKDRKRGKTNTDDFQTQVDYLLGEDWRSRVGTESGYKNEEAAYKAAEKIYKKYFNYKEENELEGGIKFLKDLKATDIYNKNTGVIEGTINEIAASMQMSSAFVEDMLGLLDSYGVAPEFTREITESDKRLAEKALEIEKAKAKVTELNAEIQMLEQELASVQEGGAEGSQYQERIAQLQAQVSEFEAIINAGVSNTGADSALKTTLQDLNEVNNVLTTLEESGINIDIILGGDWDKLKTFLNIDNDWRNLWQENGPIGNKPSSPSLSSPTYRKEQPDISHADDVIQDPIVVPTTLDTEKLAKDAEAASEKVKENTSLEFEALFKSFDGETISLPVDQSTIDAFNHISDTLLSFAKFGGYNDTFNAAHLDIATTELNAAWANLQSIEDTSSAEFFSASDRFQLAVTDFANAKASLETVINMPQTVDINANVSKAEKAISSLKNKTVTITVRTVQVGSGYASGTKKAKGGNSIVDEEGAELILRKKTGTFELGTNQGARMTNLEPGDEVYTAAETKKILARAAKVGGAYANGIKGNLDALIAEAEQKMSSSSSSSSSSKKKSSVKKVSSSSFKKYIEKLFDWIEVRLSALQRVTDQWVQSAAEAIGYVSKNATLDKALSNISKQIDTSTKAYGKYMAQADTIAKKAGLSSDIIAKIQSGAMDISSYDSNTQTKIKEYQEWYNKALDCVDAITELREQEKELAATRLDNIVDHYQWRIDRIDSTLDYHSALRDFKGVSGVQITENDFSASIDATNKKIAELRDQYNTLSNELDSMVNAGYIVEGSEQWYEYQNMLDDLDVTILETSSNLQELIDSANNITLTNLRYALTALERSATQVTNNMDLHEAQGVNHSSSDYEALIRNGMEQIRNLESQNVELRKQQSGLDELSEKYQELQEQIDSNNDAINDMMVSQEQWNDSVIDLKISEIEKYRDELTKVNEQYERQQALQQAIEDLERVRTQRNKKIFKEGIGWTWEADQQAVQEAQKALDQAIHDETMNKLDDLIEAVENLKLDSNVYSADGTLLGTEYVLPSFSGYAELIHSLGGTNIVSSAMDDAKKTAYEQVMGNVINSGSTTSLSIGDIIVNGVDSPDALAEALLAEFPQAMLRAMYHK